MEPVPHPPSDEPAHPPGAARPSSRRRWILVAAGIVALGAAFWAVRRSSTPSAPARRGPDPQATRTVPVTAAPVARRDVPVTLDGLGSVVAYRTVTVRSQVDGRLDQVLFREGQPVHAGRGARADRSAAVPDPAPPGGGRAGARRGAARERAPATSSATATLASGEAHRAAAGRRSGRRSVGQLEGAVRIDDAADRDGAAQPRLRRITSPIDGVTGVRLVDPGNLVHATDPSGIVVVTQLDPDRRALHAAAGRPARRRRGRWRAGTLAVDAFSRDGTTQLGTGELALIDNQINQATATIRLKAVFPNPRRVLWPNQFVKARLCSRRARARWSSGDRRSSAARAARSSTSSAPTRRSRRGRSRSSATRAIWR